MHIQNNAIIPGTKIKNSVMQNLLYRLRQKGNLSYRELLDVFISLDLAVETGVLTNEAISKLENDDE